MYLDSTFLYSEYKSFPTQRESVNEIIKLTENWLNANPKNVIMLRPPAAYGYEFLLVELAQHFRIKIHVSNATCKDYLHVPGFDAYISNNRLHCGRIHLCSAGKPGKSVKAFKNWQIRKSMCLPSLNENYICIIRPTAMKWKNLDTNDTIYQPHDEIDNVYFVCYSNHSSYDEIKYLIQYLRPKSIKLNVVPENICQRNEMYRIVDIIADEYRTKKQTSDNIAVVESSSTDYNFARITSIDSVRKSMSLITDDIPMIKVKKRKQF